jgi:apolipoprotein N-acyltransferase
MECRKAAGLLVGLFLSTCLFCWLMTSNTIFGPIAVTTFSIGGILLISSLGIMAVTILDHQRLGKH